MPSDEPRDLPEPEDVGRAGRETSVEEEGETLENLLSSRGARSGDGRTFELEGGDSPGPAPEPAPEPWQPEEIRRAARAGLKWSGKIGAAIAMKDPAQLVGFQVDREILEEGSEEIAEDMAPVLDDLVPKGSPRGKAMEKIVRYLGVATSVGMWGGAVAAQVAAEKALQEERAGPEEQGPDRPSKGGGDEEGEEE